MMIPTLQLRQAYFALLNNTITSNGVLVPAFDTIPAKKAFPYILLSTQSETENTCKGGNGFNASILVDIVTGFNGSYGGRKQSEEIANSVYGIIMADRHSLTLTDFYCVDTNLSESTNLQEDDNAFLIYRKILRFTHILTAK